MLKGKKESELPVYARLYYLHRKNNDKENNDNKSLEKKQNPNCNYFSNINVEENSSFIPQITQKAKRIVRSESIADCLYKDAKRRNEKKINHEKKEN